MQSTAEKPDIGEQYASATHASNLRVQADRRSSADILIAAGWSPSRLGAALLRLHSEWDGSAHPARPTAGAIAVLVGTVQTLPPGVKPDLNDHGDNKPLNIARAKEHAWAWHWHEVAMLLGKLKTLPEVRYQLELVAENWDCDNPKHVAGSIVQWWLDRQCPACTGRKFELIPNTPALGAKLCRVCRGAGESPIPCWEPGRRMVNYMDDCTQRARQSIKQRLHPARNVP